MADYSSDNTIHNEWRITIPTLFTIGRIVLTPIIVYAMVHQQWPKAFYLFLVAALTDVIDGALARFCNARTFLGGCLDAIADKFLLVSCFATLAFIKTPLFIIPQWFVLLILCKELILILGSFIVYCINGSVEIKPTVLGKGTTFVQICFIIWFFSCYFFEWLPLKTYSVFLVVLISLIIASLVQYIFIGSCYVLKNSTGIKHE
jgi:cardiolipin synthase (CMP-forming)